MAMSKDSWRDVTGAVALIGGCLGAVLFAIGGAISYRWLFQAICAQQPPRDGAPIPVWGVGMIVAIGIVGFLGGGWSSWNRTAGTPARSRVPLLRASESVRGVGLQAE